MAARVISGIGFTIVVLGSILLGGWAMLGLLSAAMVISVYEMYRALRNTGIEPVRWAGYLFCVLVIISQFASFFIPANINMPMIALVVSIMAAMIRLVSHGKIAVDSLISTMFPMIYPGIFYIALMDIAATAKPAQFIAAMVTSFFTASINDVFGLFGGMLFGKHKLAPTLSPKKTIEGSISGIIFSVAFSMLIPTLMKIIFAWNTSVIEGLNTLPPLWAFAFLGGLCGAFSQVGDLTASMVKRHCQIKDFGHLLPGHGGIMDRLDGVLFCGAACYIFLEFYKLI